MIGPQPARWKGAPAGDAASLIHAGRVRETWKYTSIDAFEADFEALSPGGELRADGVDQPGVTVTPFMDLQDAQLAAVRQAFSAIDRESYPLADQVLGAVDDGILIGIQGSLGEPLQLSAVGGCAAVIIDVAAGAELELIEDSVAPSFSSQLLIVRMGSAARMRHSRCALNSGATQWSLLETTLGADAEYQLHQYQIGGAKRRADCHIVLAGRGASASVTGAYVTEDGRHLDQWMVVEHRVGHTTSRQRFHGLGTGRSRTTFNGRIHIHPNAGGSDAILHNKNLSLGANTQINSKPELEIYTDDVRCAHGATVGQLAAESLFYLRSRGLGEAEARLLLCGGFLRECIGGRQAPTVTERFMSALL